MKVKKVVPFTKARETSLYGSKAVGLGDAARQGLPVPPGVALSGDLVEAVASAEEKAIEKVAKAIAALPEELRTPLILSEYEDLSHSEIGAVINCSSKAVETRLYRARKQLRQQLDRFLRT